MSAPEESNWGQVMHHLGELSGKLDALQKSVSEKREDLVGAFSRIHALEQRPWVDPNIVQGLMWRTAMAAGALTLVIAFIPIGLYIHGRTSPAQVAPGPVRP